MRRGYDIDGVIVRKAKDGKRPKPMLPDKHDFIITGRSFHRAFQTVIELSELMVYAPVYFNPLPSGEVNPTSAAEWKAKMIVMLGIEQYFEDDPYQIEILKAKCPGVEIVLVQ